MPFQEHYLNLSVKRRPSDPTLLRKVINITQSVYIDVGDKSMLVTLSW